jgi:hypothetical protein
MWSWIQNSNFVPLCCDVLIKGEIEKPSGFGLICDESLTCLGLNLNLRNFGGSTLLSVPCGETCLLAS